MSIYEARKKSNKGTCKTAQIKNLTDIKDLSERKDQQGLSEM